MLFNNFVEGSLKLKPFDVYITQTIVKKQKIKTNWYLSCKLLNWSKDRTYMYIYIYKFLLQFFVQTAIYNFLNFFFYKFFSNPSTYETFQIFLISIFFEISTNPHSKFSNYILLINFSKILQLSIIFSISPIQQLSSPQLQNPSKIIHLHPIIQTSSRQTSYKKTPRTLIPKP